MIFPKMSEAKVKDGIFTGQQITKMFKPLKLEESMSIEEKDVWVAFSNVVYGILGNCKDPNYKQLIKCIIDCFKKMGCRMSIKVHFLHSHLGFFKKI